VNPGRLYNSVCPAITVWSYNGLANEGAKFAVTVN
jgi:hypothetical protein